MYPPSMIAASSIGAAIHGLTARLDKRWSPSELLQRLHEITGIDVVCIQSYYKFYKIFHYIPDRRVLICFEISFLMYIKKRYFM